MNVYDLRYLVDELHCPEAEMAEALTDSFCSGQDVSRNEVLMQHLRNGNTNGV